MMNIFQKGTGHDTNGKLGSRNCGIFYYPRHDRVYQKKVAEVSILITALIVLLVVTLDGCDYRWQERRKQYELDNDSASSSKHYGGGRHFERNNRTD